MKQVKMWANGHLTVTTKATPPPPEIGAKSEKTFSLNWKAYRRITSGVKILFEQRRHKPQFITLTSRIPLHPKTFVYAQTTFLKNAIKTYGLNSYVWVLEYHKTGQPHTHIVMDIPRFNLSDFQCAWNSAVHSQLLKDVGIEFMGDNSPYWGMDKETSTLRLPKKTKKKYDKTLNDHEGMGKYMAKYAAKCVRDAVKYPCRCYGVSRNIDTTPLDLNYADFCDGLNTGDIDLSLSSYRFTSEYVDVFDVSAIKGNILNVCSVNE